MIQVMKSRPKELLARQIAPVSVFPSDLSYSWEDSTLLTQESQLSFSSCSTFTYAFICPAEIHPGGNCELLMLYVAEDLGSNPI